MLNVTALEPVPSAGLTLSHSTLLAAVHGQASAVVTWSVPPPPAAETASDGRSIEYEHPCDCVTLKRCPAIVTELLRGGPVVAATLRPTVPLPRPLAPEVIVIHGASGAAVHAHNALEARTPTCAVPPAGGTFADD
jgi:hypothetical protein